MITGDKVSRLKLNIEASNSDSTFGLPMMTKDKINKKKLNASFMYFLLSKNIVEIYNIYS